VDFLGDRFSGEIDLSLFLQALASRLYSPPTVEYFSQVERLGKALLEWCFYSARYSRVVPA
jgi:hypothetical protein